MNNLERGLHYEDLILLLFRQIPGLIIQPIRASQGAHRGVRSHGVDTGPLQAHDFQGIFADQSFDIQVKAKQQATWHRHSQRYEHGIDRPVYDEYLRRYEHSAQRLWLVFLESGPQIEGPGLVPRIRAQWWHRFRQPPRSPKTVHIHAPGGMVYFELDDMIPLFDMTMSPPQPIMAGSVMAAQMELRHEFLMRKPPTIQRRFGW